jgi:hypothetical protein
MDGTPVGSKEGPLSLHLDSQPVVHPLQPQIDSCRAISARSVVVGVLKDIDYGLLHSQGNAIGIQIRKVWRDKIAEQRSEGFPVVRSFYQRDFSDFGSQLLKSFQCLIQAGRDGKDPVEGQELEDIKHFLGGGSKAQISASGL